MDRALIKERNQNHGKLCSTYINEERREFIVTARKSVRPEEANKIEG